MTPRLWRVLALLLCFVATLAAVDDLIDASFASVSVGFRSALADSSRTDRYRVTQVTNPSTASPPLHDGDVLTLEPNTLENRLRWNRMRPGDSYTFRRTGTSAQSDLVTVRPAPKATNPVVFVYTLLRLALIAVALLVALRRPDRPEARALVGLFLAVAFAMHVGSETWAPAWFAAVMTVVQAAGSVLGGYYGLQIATLFPSPATRGWRRRLQRANPWLTGACALTSATLLYQVFFSDVLWVWAQRVSLALPIVYFVAITVAFWIAVVQSRGAERQRVKWIAFSMAVAFTGSLASIAILALHVPLATWMAFLPLTFLALPFGLGYAIVRHKVVDVGFVVNRAVVFGVVSAIVLLSFGALEWLIGNVLVRVSHITSASLELGLALVLGFSLRTIHGRVDAVVDDLFFRRRHEAEHTLRLLAADLPHVTDPATALSRTHDTVLACAEATGAPVYLVHGGDALRIDHGEEAGVDRVDVDDPALVRMRATRGPVRCRDVASSLHAEIVFPMLLRGALTGFVALGPSRSGEAYAPDEVEAVGAVVAALGTALDALQTEAMRREIARVLVEGAPVDTLRRVWDGTLLRTARLPAPEPAQPARPASGFAE